jgi:mannose-6-phosphate isomerase-like protein (cupin superfamily)
MIINHDNYMILSANSNTPFWEHWEAEPYPAWAALTGIAYVATIGIGEGIEPHYHDCDEFWLFGAGQGEGWMDTHPYEVTPNTAVYNAMGVIHRFNSFDRGSVRG